ncbi:hypothetical protein M758_6G090200 [Ceratodon purpureus]|uniref:Uncharacterized protein n=1 Tax=Ceratodon purpureus TaxID=3225 RepID=A0A8T0HCD0_CERPU|nr:hypothetical protein KC19_6G093800 [Ceratodon purpureus]KAG0613277.1 hypothetical protein M758_6G090200 [Ceratodon purpureus]
MFRYFWEGMWESVGGFRGMRCLCRTRGGIRQSRVDGMEIVSCERGCWLPLSGRRRWEFVTTVSPGHLGVWFGYCLGLFRDASEFSRYVFGFTPLLTSLSIWMSTW